MEKLILIREGPDAKLNWVILALAKLYEIEILETDLQPLGNKPPYAIVVIGSKNKFPRALKAANHTPVVWFNIRGESTKEFKDMTKIKICKPILLTARTTINAIEEITKRQIVKQQRMPGF